MILKYDLNIGDDAIRVRFQKLGGLIFKLLPMREEGKDWEIPLWTIQEEIAGWRRLILDDEIDDLLAPLCSKLEGLFELQYTGNKKEDEEIFRKYRSVIFECISLSQRIGEKI